MRKQQEILCIRHQTGVCTQETAKLENIFKTRRKKQAEEDKGNIKVTASAEDNKCPAVSSDFLEHSQNSLSSGEPELDSKGKANVSSSERDSQCLVTASEF